MNNNKKYILLDSKYRYSGTSTNFRYILPKLIKVNSYIKINYLYMPRCNYLINSSNNKIVLKLNNAIFITIILPSQNFTPLTLANYITTICQTENTTFNCTYNQFTYKLDFNSSVDFTFDFSQSNFYKLVNLNQQIYSSTNKQFSTGIVNFNIPYYLNLNISNISNDVMLGNNSNNSFNFIIPVGGSTNFGEIIQYNDVNYQVKMKVDSLTLNYLDIIITDDENNIFNNNDFNWFCILEFDGIDN